MKSWLIILLLVASTASSPAPALVTTDDDAPDTEESSGFGGFLATVGILGGIFLYSRWNEMKDTIKRQHRELNLLYQENEQLKSKLPPN